MRITPSILSADLANLGRDVDRIADADGIHIDVMDYHFVPNLSFGLPVVESLRQHTEKFLDIHLMVEDPSKWALGYAEAGADSVTFHVEAASSPIRLARDLRRKGTRASIALNPMTPIWTYEPLLSEVDMVLLMTVEPGYGGQAFLDFVLPKIRRTRQLLGDRNVWIQVDGGISSSTIEQCAEAGADTFVAGSAVFTAEDPNSMVKRLRELAISGSKKAPKGNTIDEG